MKVAVSSTGGDINSQVDPRFGRCSYFVIVETEDMSSESFNNENNALAGGAGIQSAGFISSSGVRTVLTGNCGPKAMAVFSQTGIEVFTGYSGTVKEAVEKFKQGEETPATRPSVAEKSGLNPGGRGEASQPGTGRCMGGAGRGLGMGKGSGRGMGRGGKG